MNADVDIIQLPILFALNFVLFFGIGFILNMLLKTTWFPVYVYIFAVLPYIVYRFWKKGESLLTNLAYYQITDYITIIGGLIGAILGGLAIKKLRSQGYKMF
ncbi:YuiB family protein [Chengkuizengella axinellae]|uniref:YuiB family protein n=1 Tax=Chengkuizengella axinellae TaxID=3064388 RepID=A0ABT9IU04_9BACL|nr:YuiB family protein [Chengkuizengella sp. 2205SS18-9]MDP5272582.1 YuiB family protein [Chengkuizengella sp. 2205SS18-9]